jgi:hypothetical protein
MPLAANASYFLHSETLDLSKTYFYHGPSPRGGTAALRGVRWDLRGRSP